MKIIQIIKRLNNTELGIGNTHETYILIPSDLDFSDFLLDDEEGFLFKKNNITYKLNYRLTKNGEERLKGLGPFYRENNLTAGDELLLEKHIYDDDKIDFFIDVNKRNNVLILTKFKNIGFEILNEESLDIFQNKLNTMDIYYKGKRNSISLNFLGSEKKRSDSPNKTNIYELKIDGNNVINDFKSKEMFEININTKDNTIFVKNICSWEKYLFEKE